MDVVPQLLVRKRFRLHKSSSKTSSQPADLSKGIETRVGPTRETTRKDRLVISHYPGEKLQFDYKVVVANNGPLEALGLKQNKIKKKMENTTL